MKEQGLTIPSEMFQPPSDLNAAATREGNQIRSVSSGRRQPTSSSGLEGQVLNGMYLVPGDTLGHLAEGKLRNKSQIQVGARSSTSW